MRRRFWRKVALFAMKRANLGYSPPLRWFRTDTATTTSSGANLIKVTWTQP